MKFPEQNFFQTSTGPIQHPAERQEIEEILTEFYDIFARFDVGINREFKVILTPNDDRPAYSQVCKHRSTSKKISQ